MSWSIPDEVVSVLRAAEKDRLAPASEGASLLAGHFPGQPVWPGVSQVEAVGQAGLVFVLATAAPGQEAMEVSLTRILGARFMRPVRPPADVEIVARVMEDGLFRIVVGQCLVDGRICSVAALSGV